MYVDLYDVDGSGKISIKEMMAAKKKLGKEEPEEKLQVFSSSLSDS